MKFPAIPRTPSTMLNGWNTLVNKNGREGAAEVIGDAFTVKKTDEEVTTDGGSEREAGPELEEGPDGG